MSSPLAQWRTSTVAETQSVAEALGRLLRAGDVLVLTGGLGAGKTTFTQGLAHGLGVRGPITSPTFVVAREHPSMVNGPRLVHVDAYRLGGPGELDDLDLDADLPSAVTVVEWGAGLAEALSDDYLEIVLERDDDEGYDVEVYGVETEMVADIPRTIRARGHGGRWTAAWPEIAALT